MCLETKPAAVAPHLASYSEWILGIPQLQIANPFPSNEDVFVRRIWCEKTTSSWQKVHPKQKNLPENKALLSGGAR